jgi:hypothetical protein
MGLETAGGFLGAALADPETDTALVTYTLWIGDGPVVVGHAIRVWLRVIGERGFIPASGEVRLVTAHNGGGVYAVGKVRLPPD